MSFRRPVPLAVGLALAIQALAAVESASLGTDGQLRRRLVAVSNARVRAEPSEEVRILGTVPLGSEITELEATADHRWVRVRTNDGREGWVLETLSRAFEDHTRLRVTEAIVRDRLSRVGDGIQAWIELEAFIDRVRGTLADPEIAGRFALHRLKAIRETASAGQIYFTKPSPIFDAWVKSHADVLVYHAPGGQWILRRAAILAEVDRYKEQRAADQLAWLAVTNGVPGECEGYLPCYLTVAVLLEAEYFQRMPQGVMVETGLRNLRERLELLTPPADRAADPGECREARAPITTLRSAIQGVIARWPSAAMQQDRTSAALDALEKACR